jgi:hypothetical protein
MRKHNVKFLNGAGFLTWGNDAILCHVLSLPAVATGENYTLHALGPALLQGFENVGGSTRGCNSQKNIIGSKLARKLP